MPELPEVESIVRQLDECLPDKTIREVNVRWPRIVDRPKLSDFCRQLEGQRIRGVRRRGKFIIFDLDGTDAAAHHLIAHLRMTGQFLYCRAGESSDATAVALEEDKHVHAILRLWKEATLYYRDVRKFGRLYLVKDAATIVGDLGPEPLGENLDGEALYDILHDHRRQIKPLLLDQQVIAGLGNIYVDEALWRAGIHPLRRSHRIDRPQAHTLHAAIETVLRSAIEMRGTTMHSYCTPDGEAGHNQSSLAVYGREGQDCPRCHGAIRKIRVAQRGSHYCPHCQPKPAE